MARWRGETAAVKEQRRRVQDRLDELKDAFFTLDLAQRTVREAVAVYKAVLPERAARSGLVPGARSLDHEAEQLVAEYLSLIDGYDGVQELGEQDLRQAGHAFGQLLLALRATASDLGSFEDRYSAEFALVAKESRTVETLRQGCASAVAEAQRHWEGLRAQGFESVAADTAFAKARVAQRAVESWEPTRGRIRLDEAVDLVNGFVAEVRQLSETYPARVQRASRRVPSLRIRLDAIGHRSASIPDHLGHLRREFSTGNWMDLDGSAGAVAGLLDAARSSVDDLARSVAQKDWEAALPRLQVAEGAVQAADDAVDRPRDRLTALRAFRETPALRLGRVNFVLRDAQTLVVRGTVSNTADIARRLDALALDLDNLQRVIAGVHPNYWSVLVGADRIEREVAEQVARYRERAR